MWVVLKHYDLMVIDTSFCFHRRSFKFVDHASAVHVVRQTVLYMVQLSDSHHSCYIYKLRVQVEFQQSVKPDQDLHELNVPYDQSLIFTDRFSHPHSALFFLFQNFPLGYISN